MLLLTVIIIPQSDSKISINPKQKNSIIWTRGVFMSELTNQFLAYFAPYAIPIIILGILSVVFYKKIVGAAGEFWVKRELKKLPKEYKVLNDIMIRTNNQTHQIDHVVVSKFGIFIIETKQYNGTLIGNDYDKNWTFRAGKKKFYSNNPIHQNYGHMQALKEALQIEPNKFISLVCISSNAKIKNKSEQVISINNLIPKILSYQDEILPNATEYYNRIQELNITDHEERKQHIKFAKTIKTQKEKNRENKCPKCGGNLIKRTGKYGEFFGCENYPKCKFTKNISSK